MIFDDMGGTVYISDVKGVLNFLSVRALCGDEANLDTICEETKARYFMGVIEANVKQYQDQGYTVIRGLIPRERTDAVRRRMVEMMSDVGDFPPERLQVLDRNKHSAPNGKFLINGIQRPARHDPVFHSVADHQNLKDAMAAILGGPVKLFTDQALIKNKGFNGQSFYHQDSYYWHIDPSLGCNAWIALDEVGPQAIALAIMPGTHKEWKLAHHEDYFDEPAMSNPVTGKTFQRHRIPPSVVDYSKEVILPMSPGDTAFFANYTWHRADPNNSGHDKMAYAIAYERE